MRHPRRFDGTARHGGMSDSRWIWSKLGSDIRYEHAFGIKLCWRVIAVNNRLSCVQYSSDLSETDECRKHAPRRIWSSQLHDNAVAVHFLSWIVLRAVLALPILWVYFDTIPTKNGRELMEKWVSELKDKFLGPNWQRMLSCAYTTQLLHSTGEVCWNNKDSYFIWFKFVC